jgi:hypothetical protein
VPYANAQVGDQQATVLTPDGGTASSSVPPVATTAKSVLIIGDSGTRDSAPGIGAAFYGAGATTVVDFTRAGFGLTSTDFNPPKGNWRQDFAVEVAQNHPDLVIVMLGGWDLQYLQDNGDAAYTAVVDDAVNILSSGGARVLWLSMLPGGTTVERPADRIFEQLPDRFPGVVGYADIEAAFRAPDDAIHIDAMKGAEAWPRSYVDASGNTVVLRKKEYWHVCPTGAERVAVAIDQAAADLGWATVAPPGWEQGSWRNDPRYDDPHGTCDSS